jgi:hypothetical protein
MREERNQTETRYAFLGVVKAEFISISVWGLHPFDLNLGSFVGVAPIDDHHYHARLYI